MKRLSKKEIKQILISYLPTPEEILPSVTDSSVMTFILENGSESAKRIVNNLPYKIKWFYKVRCGNLLLNTALEDKLSGDKEEDTEFIKRTAASIKNNMKGIFIKRFTFALRSATLSKERNDFLNRIKEEWASDGITMASAAELLGYCSTLSIKRFIIAGDVRTERFKKTVFCALNDVLEISDSQSHKVALRKVSRQERLVKSKFDEFRRELLRIPKTIKDIQDKKIVPDICGDCDTEELAARRAIQFYINRQHAANNAIHSLENKLAQIEESKNQILAYFPAEKKVFPLKKPRRREVNILYSDSQAEVVKIIGDFNNWIPQNMEKSPNEGWSISFAVRPGLYKYKLLVDGNPQVNPNCKVAQDTMQNNVLEVI